LIKSRLFHIENLSAQGKDGLGAAVPSLLGGPSGRVSFNDKNFAFPRVLFLTIRQPLDESVVNTGQVEVIGAAPPDTVVTVNDEILIVGPEQEFKVSIPLEEGPNPIEVLASDFEGNEGSVTLTVIYVKQ